MQTGMMGILRTAIIGLSVGSAACLAIADTPHPPLEAYGELPSVRDAAISPDGKTIAYIVRKDGKDLIATYDTETGAFAGRLGVDEISTRDIWFPDNAHLFIVTSDAKRFAYMADKLEYSGAFSLNLETNKSVPMLIKTPNLYLAQTGLGRVVGRSRGGGDVFMPAYMNDRKNDHSTPEGPRLNLLKVDLDTGKGRIVARGEEETIDWFVDEDGKILAREDFDDNLNTYRIFSEIPGKMTKIYETNTPVVPFSLKAIKADKSALMLTDSAEDFSASQYIRELSMDGQVSGPMREQAGASVNILVDHNRIAEGISHTTGLTQMEFDDPGIGAAIAAMIETFPGSVVTPVSHSDGWTRIVYLVEGNDTSGKYVLQDRASGKLTGLLNKYDQIPPAAIGEVFEISYPARDGLAIPAILTWPSNVLEAKDRKNLPLIVLPHGGPASHDTPGFDWMAQYFANRGYVVLQPNFRGSTGYGSAFETAGHGEWGGQMQDDVTDGVAALIKGGFVDPARVCIVGASYGGYSALAGGAYTPELYKCVVAYAPVTDLPRLLTDSIGGDGRHSEAYEYWKTAIGDPKDVNLEDISPVDSASTFAAPVLIIHGRDDTVVPINQSYVMQSALKKAGKDVTFIELKGEDHWLSEGDTRIQTLRAMADFVKANIGAR